MACTSCCQSRIGSFHRGPKFGPGRSSIVKALDVAAVDFGLLGRVLAELKEAHIGSWPSKRAVGRSVTWSCQVFATMSRAVCSLLYSHHSSRQGPPLA